MDVDMGIIVIYLDGIWELVAWKEGRAEGWTVAMPAFTVLARIGGASKRDRRSNRRRGKLRERVLLVTFWLLASN